MAFDAKDFVIDKVRRVTEVDLETNEVNWTVTQVEDPQVEFTGETTEKRDANGVLIAQFDTSKGVTFSGNGSLLSMPVLASQLGTEVETGTATTKVTGELFDVVPVTAGTATLTYEPKTAPAKIYTVGADKNITGTIDVGTGTDEAQVSGKTVTLPASFTGNSIGALYTFEAENAIKVTDSAENFAEAAKYIVDILAADVCNPATKRHGYLVFPKAKIDNNVSIGLTTEGNHPFSFSALADYCGEGVQLCYIVWAE